MIVHVVLLAFVENLTSCQWDRINSGAETLRAIPKVRNLTFGKTFTSRGKEYSHLLTMTFDSKEVRFKN
jgi:hypothetical protein